MTTNPPVGGRYCQQIRLATAADVPEIQQIYAVEVAHGSASFETEPPSVDDMQQRMHNVLDNGMPWLVGVHAGRICGYAYCGPYRPRHAYRFTLEDSVYVAQWARGHGVGRDLLAALIERVSGQQWYSLVAIIGDSANVGSIRLHQQAGFREVGVLRAVGFKHERWLDTVLMQLEL